MAGGSPRSLFDELHSTFRDRWNELLGRDRSATEDDGAFRLRHPVQAGLAHFSSALYQSVGARMTPGNRVDLVDNGRVFDVLVAEIEKARVSVNIVLYIWEEGAASERIVAALAARARAGVRVRVLVDAVGSPDFGERLGPRLAEIGCETRIFRPSLPSAGLARNHRKIVIIDGVVGLTGGFGIRDNWLGDGDSEGAWRDTAVCFAGPAVADAQQAFAENWQEAGGPLLPLEDFPPPEPAGHAVVAFVSSTASPVVTRAERLTQLLITAATRRLWIANAYFVPSRAILDKLGAKASDGVDVRVLVAGQKSDSKTSFGAQQFHYGELIERGVRVWEYRPSMLHSKTMLIDDHLVLVGSVNLDPLSLNTLDEGALVVENPRLAAALAKAHLDDCARAELLTE
ncbi:MAG: phosphatidylserine/phosphatidylglycerophosphate/cardiolipin synthase family protein [Byssovorax sp.]